jgi:hypothetical protein
LAPLPSHPLNKEGRRENFLRLQVLTLLKNQGVHPMRLKKEGYLC